ncbi:MAG TPA: T9SS type A sorting domain-containing protein [Saprospiraceae bacterium]|nr:T9SS type A sorting domain-containing protein [Saprospiraceae bacterium]
MSLFRLQSITPALVLVFFLNVAVKAQTNLALLSSAAASTSFVSPWESLDAVNDGFMPVNSADRTYPIYGNWNGEGDYGLYNWVQYDWDFAHDISSVAVYWFTDYGGLLKPTDAHVEYWNGIEWINAGNIGLALNTFNTLDGLDFHADKIRLYMRSDASTGVAEFQVWGTETTSCDPAPASTGISINGEDVQQQNYAVINTTDVVQLIPAFPNGISGGIMQWSGPQNFASNEQEVTLSNLSAVHSGTYTFTYVNECGAATRLYFHVTVEEQTGTFPAWSPYDSVLYYDFNENYPDFPEPALNLEDDYPGYAGCHAAWTQDYGAWTFVAGPDANPQVTPEAVAGLLQRLDGDFRFLRDSMGWPPDKLFREGYRSSVYLFGSGLCTDNASNTNLGGWQSAVSTDDGAVWPMLLLSYYPVASFDPNTSYPDAGFQRGACVHEGIHALYASLPGCRDAAWFHEGSNVWLQTVLEIEKAGGTGYENVDLGWLSMGNVLAPFIPIECYSGWLQDGTFGGPSAEGVYSGQYDADGNLLILTRNVIGGVQYSTIFPTFLGEIVGIHSLPWVWNYCEGRVLEGIANGNGVVQGLGDYRTRRLIQEYRSRLALADFERFTAPVLNMYRNFMGLEVVPEQPAVTNVESWHATPYVKTTLDAENFLIPEERTLPGWSGANIIPIHTSGDQATVTFQPLSADMSMQLCYRTPNGAAFYSQPVYGGDCSISFEGGMPANGVIFAVVCNTDYIYDGEATRTAKFDYRLKLGPGTIGTAGVDKNWWDWEAVISEQVSTKDLSAIDACFKVYPNPSMESTAINIEFLKENPSGFQLTISDISGKTVYEKANCLPLEQLSPTILTKGIYFVTISAEGFRYTKKLVVQ